MGTVCASLGLDLQTFSTDFLCAKPLNQTLYWKVSREPENRIRGQVDDRRGEDPAGVVAPFHTLN
jgi:hypothetical protein